MKIFSIMLAVAAISPPTAAFSTSGVAFRPASTQTALSMTTSSRRAALTTFASGLLLATPAAMALVDADEDSAAMVRRIAAKSEAANVAARTKKIKEEEDAKNNAGKGQNLVATGLVGSVVLSLPFFLPNLIRLGKKVASGGEDDGYGKKK